VRPNGGGVLRKVEGQQKHISEASKAQKMHLEAKKHRKISEEPNLKITLQFCLVNS